MVAHDHPLPRRHGPVYRALLRYSRALHTYVSMLALVALTFFAVTGFMLNHPTWFALDNSYTSQFDLAVPANLLVQKDKLALVEYLRAHGARGAVQLFDWPGEGEPFHVAFKAPGSECDADISLPDGQTHLTVETRGLLGLLTRLHTSKDAGPVWRLFVDAAAVLLLFVCITGVILWQSLPRRRSIGVAALVLSVIAAIAAYFIFVP